MTKTFTAMPTVRTSIPDAAILNSKPMQLLRRAFHGISRVFDLLTKWIRLVQAYNDLERLSPRALRDIGYRKDELDRILAGRRPRVRPTA